MIARWLTCLVVAAALTGTPAGAEESASSSDAQDVLFFHSGGVLSIRLHITRDGQDYQAAWGDFLWELFESLDADGSFDLDFTEFRRGPWSDFRLRDPMTGLSGGDGLRFLDFDVKPADDRVSLTELIETLAACCCQVTYSGQTNQRQVEDHLFAILDTNGDGRLDAAELADMLSTIRKADRNDDELYTAVEVQGAAGTYGQRSIVIPIILQPPNEPVSPVIAPPAGTPPEVYAAAVLRYFDHSESGETAASSSSALTHNQFPIPAEEFAAADRDGDGELNREEIADWLAARPPDVAISVRLDKELADGQRVELVEARASYADGKIDVAVADDGSIRVTLATAQVVIQAAGPANWDNLRKGYERQFESADGDNNGYLDEAEAERIGIRQQFRLADADRDGQLFLEEWLDYLQRELDVAQHRNELQIANRGSTLFEILDVSGDQLLTIRELLRLRELAEQWDHDQSGELSREEIPQRYQLTVRPGMPSTRQNFGVLSVAVARQETASVDDEGPLWFDRMDRNGDGDLSPREFLGPVVLFQRLDTDGDGLLSREEARALDEER